MRRKPDHFRPDSNDERANRSAIIICKGAKRELVTAEEQILYLAFKGDVN